MKSLIFLVCIIISLPVFSVENKHRDTALEMASLKAEYYSSSKKGIITPIDCEICILKLYHFNDQTTIRRDNKLISIQDFMNEYWKIKYPTIFIDPDNNHVLSIIY